MKLYWVIATINCSSNYHSVKGIPSKGKNQCFLNAIYAGNTPKVTEKERTEKEKLSTIRTQIYRLTYS